MKQKTIIIINLITLIFSICIKAENGLKFRGSVYSDLGLYHDHHSDQRDDFDFRGLTTLELNMQNRNQKHGKTEASVDFILPHGVYLQNMAGFGPRGIAGMDTLMVFGGNAPLLTDLRKLYLSVYLPFADLTFGRQVVNFGKGYLFSPIDAFSAVEITDLELRRRGSDIVITRIPAGMLSGIDIVVQVPFLDNTWSSALKYYTNLGGWDFSIINIYRKHAVSSTENDEILSGLAFKGDAFFGITGEAVVSTDDRLREPHFEAMTGLDYSFSDYVYIAAEYMYKQHDLSRSYWGEHNGFGSLQYKINELANISGSVIYNFEDKLTIGTLQFFYNILQNVNTTVYVRGVSGLPGFDTEYAARVEVMF